MSKFNLLCLLSLLSFYPAFSQSTPEIYTSKDTGCPPMRVSFSTNANNIKTYYWEFSNGINSSKEQPVIMFENPGSYDVLLTLIDNNGDSTVLRYENSIQVLKKPEAAFTIDKYSICNGDSVSLTNESRDAKTYYWDFGDGTTSSEKDPVHSFQNGGTYQVALISYNEAGCFDAAVLEKKITVDQIEDLDFSAEDKNLCSDYPYARLSANQQYESYHWEFGDNSTSENANPFHEYKAPGTYTVSLNVTNTNGCNAYIKKENYIKVQQIPDIDISVSDTVICKDQSVQFTNETANTASILWEVDNSQYSSENFEHIFSQPGVYDILINVTDKNGCSRLKQYKELITASDSDKPNIKIINSVGCVPLQIQLINETGDAINYSWEIDGQTINEQSPAMVLTKPGIYPVKSTTYHASGCISEIHLDSAITVKKSKATILTSSQSGCVPLTTDFRLNIDNASDFLWDFGNGQQSDSSQPVITFTEPGSHDVYVTFTNEFGCPDTLYMEGMINVYDTAILYDRPRDILICPNETVKFSDVAGNDFWDWRFGDGGISTVKNASHKYTSSGVYTVSLKTKNNRGCLTTIPDYATVKVHNIPDQPVFYEEYSCPQPSVSMTTQTTDSALFKWDFGDGNFFVGDSAHHLYDTPGLYLVKLFISDINGCNSNKAFMINIPFERCTETNPADTTGTTGNAGTGLPDTTSVGNNQPDSLVSDTTNTIPVRIPIEYDQQEITGCSVPFKLTFYNQVTHANSWIWDFGDNTSSTEKNPFHTYTEPGTFFVSLYAIHDSYTDSLVNYLKIIIHDPKPNFTFQVISKCDGVDISFEDQTNMSESWLWKIDKAFVSDERMFETHLNKDGGYQIDLTTTDSLGCTNRLVNSITAGNPYPDFRLPEISCSDQEIGVSHNISGFRDYKWDFGDGTIITGEFPVHTYSTPGSYNINLYAIDNNGCEKAYPVPEKILINQPQPDFDIIGSYEGCDSLEVTFSNLSSGATEWIWDFGNGHTSTEENPQILFTPGTYDIQLTAIQNGCSKTIEKKDFIKVYHVEAGYAIENPQDQFCIPTEISFVDKSTGATSWLWEFGDGTTSNQKNPKHLFTAPVTKEIKLTVENDKGCSSVIKSIKPEFFKTKFESKTRKGCLPYTATFTDKTKEAVKWYWDFGDGSYSYEQNPSHVYTSEGTFSVQLITESVNGCTDTLFAKDYIKVGYLKADFHSTIPESFCAPVIAGFTDKSIGATSHEWSFGDESSSKITDPIHVYSKVGQYDVSLTVSNDLGCVDSIRKDKLITSIGPEAKIGFSDSIVCEGSRILFTDESASAVKWEWLFGDGSTSSEQNPSYLYAPGSYRVGLMVTDQYGCGEYITYDSVRTIRSPKAAFEASIEGECLPVTVKVVNTSENTEKPVYSWDPGNGRLITEFEPVIQYSDTGTYQLSLTVTNDSFCSNTTKLTQPVIVRDTFHTIQPDILQLSVDEGNDVRFTVNPSQRNNIRYYVVYRRHSDGPGLSRYDTIYTPGFDTYTDPDVEAGQYSYSYKFQTFEYCASPSPVDDLTVYTSLLLSATSREDDILLRWNNYHGHSFKNYTVMRKRNNNTWEIIAELSTETNTYSDSEDLCPDTYEYKVVATNLNGIDYHSESNKVEITPVRNRFPEQIVDVTRSTVVDNTFVFTEWKAPEIAPEKIVYYEIWKSTDDSQFKQIDQVYPPETIYSDKNVDVQNHQYSYKIKTVNTCMVPTELSNMGSSILLQKKTEGYQNSLFWTEDTGWEEGIQQYYLQKQNESGEWETIRILGGNENGTVIDLSDEE